jgi:hypothetical protein
LPSQATGADYRVRITSVTVPAANDQSDADFSIVP